MYYDVIVVALSPHSLAKPRMNMFDPIKRTVTTSLKLEFERFKSTDIYEGQSIPLSSVPYPMFPIQ